MKELDDAMLGLRRCRDSLVRKRALGETWTMLDQNLADRVNEALAKGEVSEGLRRGQSRPVFAFRKGEMPSADPADEDAVDMNDMTAVVRRLNELNEQRRALVAQIDAGRQLAMHEHSLAGQLNFEINRLELQVVVLERYGAVTRGSRSAMPAAKGRTLGEIVGSTTITKSTSTLSDIAFRPVKNRSSERLPGACKTCGVLHDYCGACGARAFDCAGHPCR